MHNQINPERGCFAPCLGLKSSKLTCDCIKPCIQPLNGSLVLGRKGANNTSLATGNHKLRT